ncbi:MAG: hypothetical protein WBO10_02740 [Pyrinomonadaceae bacterium]
MTEDIVKNFIAALSATGIDSETEEIEKWIMNAGKATSERMPDSEQIKEIAQQAAQQGSFSMDIELSRRNLARWFEVPEEEFKDTLKEQLEPEVLIRHIILENMFKTWLEEWNYDVEVGEDLEGIENIEFVPDLYASRVNLHGSFEIVVCFVCDNPPNTYRVRALFETFESFARQGSEFGERDIFFVVTPFTFGKGITQSITLQNNEEEYTVVALEGNDLSILQSIRTADKRLLELIEHVEKAKHKSESEKLLRGERKY